MIWGKETLGFNVVSDGKLYPISLIFTFLILPIEVLCASRTAPLPTAVVTVVIPGRLK